MLRLLAIVNHTILLKHAAYDRILVKSHRADDLLDDEAFKKVNYLPDQPRAVFVTARRR